MQLIRYKPEFQQAILALHRSAMEGIATGMTQAEEEADLFAIEQAYWANGGEFLVGLVDGEVMAIGGFRRTADGAAEIKRMRIRGDLQGRGYGTALLAELERLARERGMGKLCLETAVTRRRAPAFYRKRGYQVRGYGSYGAVETVQFEKELG
jgi:GNAT superfamily N-acetyltransferase